MLYLSKFLKIELDFLFFLGSNYTESVFNATYKPSLNHQIYNSKKKFIEKFSRNLKYVLKLNSYMSHTSWYTHTSNIWLISRCSCLLDALKSMMFSSQSSPRTILYIIHFKFHQIFNLFFSLFFCWKCICLLKVEEINFHPSLTLESVEQMN